MLEPVTQLRILEASGARARRGGTAAAPDGLPDLLLIERARAREERAIEALIRRYSRRMFRVACSVLLDEDAAESAVQDAHLAAFGDRNRRRPRGARDHRAHPHVPRAAAPRPGDGAPGARGTRLPRADPGASRWHRKARTGAATSRLDADDQRLDSLKGHAVADLLAEQ